MINSIMLSKPFLLVALLFGLVLLATPITARPAKPLELSHDELIKIACEGLKPECVAILQLAPDYMTTDARRFGLFILRFVEGMSYGSQHAAKISNASSVVIEALRNCEQEFYYLNSDMMHAITYLEEGKLGDVKSSIQSALKQGEKCHEKIEASRNEKVSAEQLVSDNYARDTLEKAGNLGKVLLFSAINIVKRLDGTQI